MDKNKDIQFANKALFLDRDGVINVDHGYVHQIENFEFIDGIMALVKNANLLGFKVIVLSNQSGIGRGLYSKAAFYTLTDWMLERFMLAQAKIDRVYFCPHHPKEAISDYKTACARRKPNIGMALDAQRDFSLDLTQSIMVGDKRSDLDFAVNANLASMFWLRQHDHATDHSSNHTSPSLVSHLSSYVRGNTHIQEVSALSQIVLC